MTRFPRLLHASLVVVAVSALALPACQNQGGSSGSAGGKKFRSIGSAPVGGVFYTMGGAVSDILNENKGENDWQFSNESTGGSMENIRRLTSGDIDIALSNASITYFAVRGEEGFDQAYPVQAVMTLFPNIAMFVVKKDSGITKVQDLKGKRVAIGPEGAGFEYFVKPLLKAHGLTFDDIEEVYGSQQSAVDYLSDGSVAAAFLGGGVPTASITSAAATMDILLVPYGDQEKVNLTKEYPFFHEATIPAKTYSGQDEAFQGLNVGSAHLIVAANADEDFVYQVTKIIYENRDKISEKHKAGNAITPENVVRNVGTEFHPGAIKYYKEAGIWPDSDASKSDQPAETPAEDKADANQASEAKADATDEKKPE